ncbi:MAG TPA: 2,3,4,5-tetrahydropyridine-2,6-dicarboxylate N-succinyltransferase [Conexibacter sp.]|nr:2,3,4,5-tetrahydropyridine-2,6-dicarboxylate N-succinyltransferase [Conexibacter sp.]
MSATETAAHAELRERIAALWEQRTELTEADAEARATVFEAVGLLDRGEARIAEVGEDGEVVVHEWLRHVLLLMFRVGRLEHSQAGPFRFADRLPLKEEYPGVRVVPGASARFGSYLEPGAILMPSFVNVGARVGSGTLIDTWATVGSCAQVGRNVHVSGGVGIGGVLEPPAAKPVVIEDDALLGSRCIVVEGARVGRGAVLGAGAILGPTIPVFDAQTGEEISRGRVPDWSVAIAATRPREFAGGTFGLACVLVIKRLAEGERHDKAAIEALVRDHGASL